MSSSTPLPQPWASVRQRLRERGLRWTPQRRAVVEALAGSDGHVTGAELLERCRAIDPATIPSTRSYSGLPCTQIAFARTRSRRTVASVASAAGRNPSRFARA